MTHRFRSSAPRRSLAISVLAVVFAFGPTATAPAVDTSQVSVLTRNVYVGTGLDNLVTATTFPDFVAAVTRDWANVLATDFQRRAKALAIEIQFARPYVVGLQEVSRFREQLVSDTVQGNPTPNAETDVYDFLTILQAELAARGVPYTAVSTSTNADAESPRANPASPIGFTDVRLTDRDVILARADIGPRFSNPRDGHYAAQFGRRSVAGPLAFTRGWTSIDYAMTPIKSVRIFNTHLETSDAAPAQVAQGNEALAILNSSPHPVIALGDYNSAADGSTTATYTNLTNGGLADSWRAFQPLNPGRTCCQDELLNTLKQPTERLDLVLTKGAWRTLFAVRTGALPFRLAPPPLWASDHFGVFAILRLN